jgi:hypothetical protein
MDQGFIQPVSEVLCNKFLLLPGSRQTSLITNAGDSCATL